MKKGVVLWFNNTKGYGFIQEVDSEESYFVHFSAINKEGFKSLDEGELVSFDLGTSPEGKQCAINVAHRDV